MPPLMLCSMSVRDFCLAAKSFLREGRDADFVSLMLNGIYNYQQVVIDPIVDSVDAYEILSASRDFDSHDDTLTRDVHLKYSFTTSKGALRVPVHKVPNVALAKWDTHHKVLVMFPELYGEGRSSSQLTQDEMAAFYEKGLRPAVASITPVTAAEWPATYSDEMFRARGPKGQLSFCTKVIADWLVPDFAGAIREALEKNGVSWGQGLVFLHQIRGVKHSSTHSANSRSADDALDIFLKDNCLAVDREVEVERDAWWIDVGFEVISDFDHCLAWRTDSHTHIIERALSISSDAAQRLTRPGSTLYARDLTSHLTMVSGCRITPGASHGPHSVAYAQLYNTDKALIYRPDGTAHGKYITAAEVLAGKGPRFTENLIALYNNAIKTCFSRARIELRVPLSEGHLVLLNLDDLLPGSLVSFNPNVWWSLRSLRATAFKFVMIWQSQGDYQSRTRPSALLLTAACAVMLSTLHSTFDNGASTRELLKLALPHVKRAGADPNILAYGSARHEDDEDEDEEMLGESESSSSSDSDEEGAALAPPVARRRGPSTLPANPYGMTFLRLIRFGSPSPVPRIDQIGGASDLSTRASMFFFNEPDYKAIREALREQIVSMPVNPDRVNNKRKPSRNRGPPYRVQGRDPMRPVFRLKEKGARIPPRPRDTGSDIDMEAEKNEASEADDTSDIDEAAAEFWHSFLIDITQVSPNYGNAFRSSYTKLTKNDRLLVDEDTYKNRRLSDYFHDCQWKYATRDEWNKCFNYLFPDKNQPPRSSKTQNYFKMTYFVRWEETKQRIDPVSHELLRKAMKAEFDKLYWMPAAVKERVWWTKIDPKLEKSSGITTGVASPRILINSDPSNPPLW